MIMDMKRTSIAAACALVLIALASCNKEEGLGNMDKTPVTFSGTMSPLTSVLGDTFSQTWQADDELGIYVYATTEMKYKVNESSASTGFTALQADIPASYGKDAYAIYPPCSGKSRFDASISVPEIQTVKDGINASLFHMAAKADVEDHAADFEFKHLTAALNLGLCATDPIEISKIEISAVTPSRSSYLAGSADVILTENPELGDISKGSNTIVVELSEPAILSSTPIYIPVSVFPFSTISDGLAVKVYEKRGYPCDLGTIWTETNAISDAGAVTLNAGECATEVLPTLAYDMFDMPGTVKISIKDGRTQSVRPGQDISIWSVTGNTETLVGTYTSDTEGIVNAELNAGKYAAYSAYREGCPEKSNRIEFTVSSGIETSLEFVIMAIVFMDDFSWSNQELFPGIESLYGDVANHVANTATQYVKQYSAMDETQKAAVASHGWSMTSFVYARPGYFTLGKKNGVGTITTDALSSISSGNIQVNFNITPWHTVTGGVWKLEYSQIVVKVIGGGSFSETEQIDTYKYDILESGGDSDPEKQYPFSIPVYGATSSTQISFSNGKPSASTSTMYRLIIDDVAIIEN